MMDLFRSLRKNRLGLLLTVMVMCTAGLMSIPQLHDERLAATSTSDLIREGLPTHAAAQSLEEFNGPLEGQIMPTEEAAFLQQPSGSEPTLIASGTGRASAPAESAFIQAVVYKSDGSVVRSNEVAGHQAALLARGVRNEDMTLKSPSTYITGSCSYAELIVKVTSVTRQRMLDLVNAMTQTGCIGTPPTSSFLRFYRVGVVYLMNDCGSLERQALEAAITEARTRVERLANVMNAQLANMKSASFSSSALSGSLCGSSPLPSTFPAFDPTAPADVVVSSTATLTFAIQ